MTESEGLPSFCCWAVREDSLGRSAKTTLLVASVDACLSVIPTNQWDRSNSLKRNGEAGWPGQKPLPSRSISVHPYSRLAAGLAEREFQHSGRMIRGRTRNKLASSHSSYYMVLDAGKGKMGCVSRNCPRPAMRPMFYGPASSPCWPSQKRGLPWARIGSYCWSMMARPTPPVPLRSRSHP